MQNDTLLTRYDAKVLARFYPKIDKTDSCWVWTSNRGWKGHGFLKVDGRQVAAHRISHEIYKGPIPDGMVIDHMCHNTSCVNPDHLRAVLHKHNMENRGGAHKNSKSGVRGVMWNKRLSKWEVRVTDNGQRHHGGYHVSIDDAERAAIQLRNSLFTYNDVDRGNVIA